MTDLVAKRLQREGWSEEAIRSYLTFGSRCALLYPYIGKSVNTPRGTGELKQAIGDTALVVLDREKGRGRWSGKEKRPMSEFRVEEVQA